MLQNPPHGPGAAGIQSSSLAILPVAGLVYQKRVRASWEKKIQVPFMIVVIFLIAILIFLYFLTEAIAYFLLYVFH